jgi:hypothetical protein
MLLVAWVARALRLQLSLAAAPFLLDVQPTAQAPDAGGSESYDGPTALAAVQQPESTTSRLIKELKDRCG